MAKSYHYAVRPRRAWIAEFGRKADASIAVEFALISPILIAMIGALIDFSFIYYTFNSAQQSGWQVARQVAIGQLQATNAASTVRNQLPAWVQSKAVIPTVVLSSGVYTVTVTIAISDATPIKFLKTVYGSSTLTTKASFISEGG